MATNIGTVSGFLVLHDRFTGPLKKATGQLALSGKKMQAIGQKMTVAGAGMTRALTVPIALIGVGAVVAFAKFDDKMTESLAIMGDVSDAMKEDMAATARETALTVEASAKDMAEGYFFLASAGLSAAASIAVLPTVAKFAQAGAFDLALATDLLTDAQSALGLTIRDDVVKNMENMVRVSDVLVKANTLANASVEQFSVALTTEAGAALKSFNKDIEEGVAVLAAFADQGVKGQTAGTGLSRILRLMTAAAVKNSDTYEKLGIEVFDAGGKMNNMADIVEDLEDAFDGMSDKQRTIALDMLGFKARVQGVILPLIGTSDAIRRYEKELRNAGGTTEEVAAKQMESFLKQMKLVGARLMDVAIGLGSTLAPSIKSFAEDVLVPAIEKLAAFAKWFGNLPDPMRNTSLALIAIAAVAGPVVFVLGNLTVVAGLAATSVGTLGNASLISATKLQTLGLWAGRLALPLTALAALFSAFSAQSKDITARVVELSAELASGATTTEKLRANFERLAKVPVRDRVNKTTIELAALRAIFKKLEKPVGNAIDFQERYNEALIEAEVSMRGQIKAGLDFLGPLGDVGDGVIDLTDELSSLDQMLNMLKEGSVLGAASNFTDLKSALESSGDAVKKNEERFQLLSKVLAVTSRTSLTDFLALMTELRRAMISDPTLIDEYTAAWVRFNEQADDVGDGLSELSRKISRTITDVLLGAVSVEDALKGMFTNFLRDKMDSFFDGLVQGFFDAKKAGVGAAESISSSWKQSASSLSSSTGTMTKSLGKVGLMIAAIAGVIALARHFSGNMRKAADAAREFELALSEELLDTIDATASRIGDLDAAFLLLLEDTIKEVGIKNLGDLGKFLSLARKLMNELAGATTDATDDFEGFISSIDDVTDSSLKQGEVTLALGDALAAIVERFREAGGQLGAFNELVDIYIDLLAKVAEGHLTAEAAGDLLGRSLSEIISIALELGDEAVASVGRLVDAARAAGVTVEALADALEDVHERAARVIEDRNKFILEQGSAILAGLEKMFQDSVGITERQVEFAATAVVQAFDVMFAAGMPVLSILDQLGESFAAILERGQTLGVDLPDAFLRLGEVLDILGSKKVTRFLTQLDGLAAATAALGNLGSLSAGQFDTFGDSVRRAFRRLIDQGLSAEEALAILAPQLQLLNDLSQQYGFELDANTQKLLDNALAQGVVKDAGLSMEDILITGFDRMLEALNALIVVMGGVPVMFEQWGDAASDAADEITRLNKTIGNFGSSTPDFDRAPSGDAPDRDLGGRSFRQGSGGLRDFSALGTPAILHGREEVLTAKQGSGVAAMVASVISGGGGEGLGLLAGSIDDLSHSLIRQQASVEIERRDESIKSTE